jgi:hypothetical protein
MLRNQQPPERSAAAPESFTAGNKLITSTGKPVNRYGSVKQACQILGDCDPRVIHELIHAGTIKAFKLRPDRPNSHWRVDLLSVWNHKQAQLQ